MKIQPKDVIDAIVNGVRSLNFDPGASSTPVAPEKVQRAIELMDLAAQVEKLAWEYEEQAGAYLWLQRMMVSEEELYAVFNAQGKLFRSRITVSDGTATLGELVAVEEEYMPISRSVTVQRDRDGAVRIHGTAATALLNRDFEIDSTSLFDNMILKARATGVFPKIDVLHLGGLDSVFDVGAAAALTRVGIAYVVGGTIDESHPLGAAMVRSIESGDRWGMSIEYVPLGDALYEIEVGGIPIKVYRDGFNSRITLLPERFAASHLTSVNVTRRETAQMTVEELLKTMGEEQRTILRGLVNTDEEWDEMLKGLAEVQDAGDAIGAVTRAVAGAQATDDNAEDPPKDDDDQDEGADNATVPGEGAAGEEPVTSLELDDEAVQAISREIAASMGSVTEELAATVQRNGEALEAITEQLAELPSLSERLEALEAARVVDEAETMQDLPATMLSRMKVTYRPRHQNGGEGAGNNGQPQSYDDLAANALEGLD